MLLYVSSVFAEAFSDHLAHELLGLGPVRLELQVAILSETAELLSFELVPFEKT